MMKKILKNHEIVVCSEQPLDDMRFYEGFGMLNMERKVFHFEVTRPERRRKNPLIYNGKYFRVRCNKDGAIRFTAVFRNGSDALKECGKETFIDALSADLKSALVKLSKYCC